MTPQPPLMKRMVEAGSTVDGLPLSKTDMHPLRTFRRRCVYRDFFICEFAVDQQVEVDSSIGVELPTAIQADLVEDEVQTRLPLDISRYYYVTGAFGRCTLDYLETLKHRKAPVRLSFG